MLGKGKVSFFFFGFFHCFWLTIYAPFFVAYSITVSHLAVVYELMNCMHIDLIHEHLIMYIFYP